MCVEEIDDTCAECGDLLGSALLPDDGGEVPCCVNPDCDLFDVEVTEEIDDDHCAEACDGG